jgi:outer membrane protein assembly factor BamE
MIYSDAYFENAIRAVRAPPHMFKAYRWFTAALSLSIGLTLLPGCEWVRPYRIDIRQGSEVTGEMVGRLKVGMTPDQVRFVLGTPLLTDPFHAERWDYPYEYRIGRQSSYERHLFSVFFKDGKLERWTGDVEPVSDEDAGQNRVLDIAPKQ